jgi:hypothetical protein
MRDGQVVADGPPGHVLAATEPAAALLAASGLTPPPLARVSAALGIDPPRSDVPGLLTAARDAYGSRLNQTPPGPV